MRSPVVIVQNQARNVIRALRGQPLRVTHSTSQTLDADDIELAHDLLKRSPDADDTGACREFEAAFASWNGSAHAVSFDSGRLALSACIDALDLKAGDQAIVPGYTCVVVANSFRYAEVEPVFCDIELETFGPDVSSVERCITPRTRAIVVQHLYGLVCRDYLQILELAKARGLRVIEDCAHATGATLDSIKVGNRGDLAFYSLEQSKVLTTFRGGIATSNDAELGARLRSYWQALPQPSPTRVKNQIQNLILSYYLYKHPQRAWLRDWALFRYGSKHTLTTTVDEVHGKKPPDYGLRMAAPIARLGLHQLGKLDRYNERRREGALRWDLWCEAKGFTKPLLVPGSVPVFLRYPVLMDARAKQDPKWARSELKIDLGTWFRTYLHPSNLRVEGCPNATIAVERCVNLPTLLEHH